MQLNIHTDMIQQPKLQHNEKKMKQKDLKKQFNNKNNNNWKLGELKQIQCRQATVGKKQTDCLTWLQRSRKVELTLSQPTDQPHETHKNRGKDQQSHSYTSNSVTGADNEGKNAT